MAPDCPACGAEVESGAQFCDACGAALVAPVADDAVARKIVTIAFADLIGSTSLQERLDPESVRRLMDRYHRAMGAAVEAHGGTVLQLLGDGVLAAFGVPRVAEDDAFRGVRGAAEMQRAFRELAREHRELATPVGLRVAVHTGEFVVRAGRTDIIGDPLNVAGRLQQEAQDGDVLISDSTRRLVNDRVTLELAGTYALKGRTEPVSAYRLVSLERPPSAPSVNFVGREDELRRLMQTFDTAVATPAGQLVVLLGSPGLGKSRLIDEFGRRLDERATILAAHCDAAEGATFAPLARTLRALFAVGDGTAGAALREAIEAVLPGDSAERARISVGIAALLAGSPARREEAF